MKNEWRILVGVCALVVGVYAYMAQSGVLESVGPDAADTYYNLLVQGFRAGQLSLKKEVPPGFTRLADPYDPTANSPYRLGPDRLHDLSYYKGRLYLYFGVTPALILFWPFVALTGHYLSHTTGRGGILRHRLSGQRGCAVARVAPLLCRSERVGGGGLRAGARFGDGRAGDVAALRRLRSGDQLRVYADDAGAGGDLEGVARAGAESAGGWRPRVWRTGWRWERGRRLLFGAVILLVPVVQAWRERRRMRLLIAAIGPIAVVGVGLMLYNALRFGSPFEFGLHYQLAVERQVARQFFRLRYVWFNFRVYFLEPARWSVRGLLTKISKATGRLLGSGLFKKLFIFVNLCSSIFLTDFFSFSLKNGTA